MVGLACSFSVGIRERKAHSPMALAGISEPSSHFATEDCKRGQSVCV